MARSFKELAKEWAAEQQQARGGTFEGCVFAEDDADIRRLNGHLAAMKQAELEAATKRRGISRYATPEQRAAEESDINQAAYDQIRAHRREATALLDQLKARRDELARRGRNLCEPHKLTDWQEYDIARESIRAKVRRAGPDEAIAEYQAAIGDAAKYAIVDAARAQVEALTELPNLADDEGARRRLVGWQRAVTTLEAAHYQRATDVDASNGALITVLERGLGQQYGATEKRREAERIDRLYGTRVAHLETEPIEQAAVIPFRESSGIQRTPEPEAA